MPWLLFLPFHKRLYTASEKPKKERLASRPAIELSCFPFAGFLSQDRANLNPQLTNLRRMPNSLRELVATFVTAIGFSAYAYRRPYVSPLPHLYDLIRNFGASFAAAKDHCRSNQGKIGSQVR